MNGAVNPLYQTFGIAMMFCYRVARDYGLAIILFTLLSKIVMLPISIWVQNNSIKMVKMQPDLNFIKITHYGDKDAIADEEAKLYKREKYNPFASVIPMLLQILLLMGVIEAIKMGMQDPQVNMHSLGVDLSLVPSEVGLSLIWSPLVAGFSAWLRCSMRATVMKRSKSLSTRLSITRGKAPKSAQLTLSTL